MEAAAVHDAAQQQQAQAASELSTARALIGVSSGVSFVTALAMVLYFSVFQESRRCGRRLLFCLHLADAGAACAWLLVFWLPSEAPGSANAAGDVLSGTEVGSSLVSASASSSPTCYAQAYLLLFFMLASCLWTACFAFHLFQILGQQGKTTTPELYESRYHLVAWGVPLLTVVHLGLQQALGYDLVGESGLPWCWVRTWSDFEWAASGVYIQLSVFYIPLLLILLHNLTIYLSLLYKMQSDAISSKMEAQICARMVAYSCAFFFAFVWGFVGLLYQVITPEHSLSPPLLYLMCIFMPLQGAMNTAAYGINKKVGERFIMFRKW